MCASVTVGAAQADTLDAYASTNFSERKFVIWSCDLVSELLTSNGSGKCCSLWTNWKILPPSRLLFIRY